MKVLHFFGQMNTGGAETRTIEIFEKIREHNYNFYFVSCSAQAGYYDKKIRELGGKVFYLNIYSITFPIRLFSLLKKGDFDIVESHIHYVSGYIMLIAWLAGCKKRITHFRVAGDTERNKSFKNILLKILVKLFSTDIIAVSNSTMLATIGSDYLKDKRCKVLYNGIQTKTILQNARQVLLNKYHIDSAAKIILNVGRMDYQKNHFKLLSIFKEYANNLNVVLLLVGNNDTPIGNALKKKVNEMGLNDKVIFCGITSNIRIFYCAADVMLFPSLYEGLPGVLLEALSFGLPVVASKISEHEELIQYLIGLYLVNLNDKNSEWNSAIDSAIALNKIHRDKISRCLYNSLFTLDKHICNLMDIYEHG